MNHEQYATKLFKHIFDKGFAVRCYTEGERISYKDIINEQVEEAEILIINKTELDAEGYKIEEGFIHWIGCNDWDESISDYTLELDDTLGLDKFMKSNSSFRF
tara:strand:- start:505 stop:813 length:309 start_codon:yes stop_codon:yes gene_type:complete